VPPRVFCAVLVLASAGRLAASDAPSMPTWLTPYPGATERTRSMGNRVWSNYLTAATLEQTIEYYHGLFDRAGLTFHPVASSLTTSIRGAAPECSFEVLIHGMGRTTSVEVTCIAWASGSSEMQNQAKFDKPVYPKARAPIPPLAWPDWLTTCESSASPEIQSGVDRFKLKFLKVEFTSGQDRETIQSFYADLLNAHDYPVAMRSSSLTPKDHLAIVEGAHYFNGRPGPRFAIHVQLTPVNGAYQVELRLTAHPM
jgi:hypothetical protein